MSCSEPLSKEEKHISTRPPARLQAVGTGPCRRCVLGRPTQAGEDTETRGVTRQEASQARSPRWERPSPSVERAPPDPKRRLKCLFTPFLPQPQDPSPASVADVWPTRVQWEQRTPWYQGSVYEDCLPVNGKHVRFRQQVLTVLGYEQGQRKSRQSTSQDQPGPASLGLQLACSLGVAARAGQRTGHRSTSAPPALPEGGWEPPRGGTGLAGRRYRQRPVRRDKEPQPPSAHRPLPSQAQDSATDWDLGDEKQEPGNCP